MAHPLTSDICPLEALSRAAPEHLKTSQDSLQRAESGEAGLEEIEAHERGKREP